MVCTHNDQTMINLLEMKLSQTFFLLLQKREHLVGDVRRAAIIIIISATCETVGKKCLSRVCIVHYRL